jgi:hypothetical protein
MSIKTQIKSITPRIATQWLERNLHNRPMNEAIVARYVTDMKNGRWVLHHQGIAFDEKGDLLDGQKRLKAIIDAGVTIPMMVTTGLPVVSANGVAVHTMDVVDCNQVRTVGQNLGLRHGYSNGNVVAAAARVIAEICTDQGTASKKVTLPQTLAILKTYGKAIDEVLSEVHSAANKRAPLIGTFAFARLGCPEAAVSFASSFFSMEELKRNHPALALRRWIDNHPQCISGGQNRFAFVKVVCSAIYHHSQGSTLTKIYQNDEAVNWLISAQKKNVKDVRVALGYQV